jgi:CBS domain-containing protein
MKCYELMTPDPKMCVPEDNVADIATLMWKHDDHDNILFGDLPVVKDLESKELVGVITYRNIAIHMLGHSYEHPSKVKVSECMSYSVVTCNAEDTVETAAQLMREHGVGRIPVVDEKGCCIGIISWANLLIPAYAGNGLHTENDSSSPAISSITTGCGLLR